MLYLYQVISKLQSSWEKGISDSVLMTTLPAPVLCKVSVVIAKLGPKANKKITIFFF